MNSLNWIVHIIKNSVNLFRSQNKQFIVSQKYNTCIISWRILHNYIFSIRRPPRDIEYIAKGFLGIITKHELIATNIQFTLDLNIYYELSNLIKIQKVSFNEGLAYPCEECIQYIFKKKVELHRYGKLYDLKYKIGTVPN